MLNVKSLKLKVINTAVVAVLLLTTNAPVAFASHNSVNYQASINRGLNYLEAQQQTDGSITGFPGITDWAAIAFTTNNQDVDTVKNPTISLKQYLINNPPTSSSSASDWARATLGVLATGENPTNIGGVNYRQSLENHFNNGQLGDLNLVNDDIFGLLALLGAGSEAKSTTNQAILNFILSQQNDDGGFSWSTSGNSDSNDTAAAIQTLQAARKVRLGGAKVASALAKAKRYLYSTQNDDGGFGYDQPSSSDGSSTAWSLMALNAVGLDNSSRARNAKNYLVANQTNDGGYAWQNAFGSDTYTTSHALTALVGKTWLLYPSN